MSLKKQQSIIRERIDQIDTEIYKIREAEAEQEYQYYRKKNFIDNMYNLCEYEDSNMINILDQKKHDLERHMYEDQNDEAFYALLRSKTDLEDDLENLIEEQRRIERSFQMEENAKNEGEN